MPSHMKNEEKIQAKKEEVANYERILSEYQGRWYDYGRRSLARLKEELIELEKDSPE